jgi:hypothetical protein
VPLAGPAAMRAFDPANDRSGSRSEELDVIAVGTVIANRPPPRSVRAEFPHTAPTSGV